MAAMIPARPRNCPGRVLRVLALLAALPHPGSATAQQPEIDPEKTIRITLGNTAAQPQETALVPVYLTPPKSLRVGRVRFAVTFVSANVQFERVEPGPFADPNTTRFSAAVAAEKNESGTETTTATVEAIGTAEEGLPSGLIAYLALRIRETARPAKITLRTSAAEASPAGATEPWPDVRAFDAQLEVQAPGYSPTVVCFFFSH
ncbi:MAG TPA: hypothetical protein VNN17_02775 [Terriglobia bacterium]|nr:hypothetical protein [Terriglobia bacterium]